MSVWSYESVCRGRNSRHELAWRVGRAYQAILIPLLAVWLLKAYGAVPESTLELINPT